ncbi:hypothetical protein [Ekhidna sp. To15]|uniref:hypothetical protein n=1 Tax=Ekhidna sp. To15 TaxID=3395267 RepID=UPI003F51CEE1
MGKDQKTNRIVMVIGAISLLFSVYSAYIGRPFSEYFFGLIIGISLFGVAYINSQKQRNKGED